MTDANYNQNHALARCARAACQCFIGQHGGGRHKVTGWRYCWPCSRKINEAAGEELIPFPAEHHILTPEQVAERERGYSGPMRNTAELKIWSEPVDDDPKEPE